MKLTRALVALSCAAVLIPAIAAQSAPPDDLPDAPTTGTGLTIQPNGPSVVFDTSMGRITCQFYEKQAPHAVANFIALAEGTRDWTDPNTGQKQHHKPYYNNTSFHRVIPEFMIQGGDPTGTGAGDPGFTFNDEIDPNLNFDKPGRLAMANSGPNTNGAQFFITEVPYESLNQHYTLFGQCDASSVEVVKSIARVPTNAQDKPIAPVLLSKVTIVRPGQPMPPKPGEKPQPVEISAAVAQGLLVSHVAPVYSLEARKASAIGSVTVDVIIGTDGQVQSARAIEGPELLQSAAVDAVRQYHYRPYLLNGQPVEVHTQVNVAFSLPKHK